MSQIIQSDQTSGPNKADMMPAMNNMSPSEIHSMPVEGPNKPGPEDKPVVVEKASNGLRQPDRRTSDALWFIIIISFAIVLVGTFISLAVGVLVLGKSAANAELQILLTMFTAAVAFLAGLLTQGPTGSGQSTGQ